MRSQSIPGERCNQKPETKSSPKRAMRAACALLAIAVLASCAGCASAGAKRTRVYQQPVFTPSGTTFGSVPVVETTLLGPWTLLASQKNPVALDYDPNTKHITLFAADEQDSTSVALSWIGADLAKSLSKTFYGFRKAEVLDAGKTTRHLDDNRLIGQIEGEQTTRFLAEPELAPVFRSLNPVSR